MRAYRRRYEVPAASEQPRFETLIKPLFRENDRRSMQFAFDLWSHGDVKEHAGDILERVSNGTMPCDEAWPPERVAVFRNFENGMPE
jgi:hypothetical protein